MSKPDDQRNRSDEKSRELDLAASHSLNASFVSDMKASSDKEHAIFDEQIRRSQDEVTAAHSALKAQKESYERTIAALKAQVEELQSAMNRITELNSGGDNHAKALEIRAHTAESKVSQLQQQVLSLQSQVDELNAFKKSTEGQIRESPAFAAEVGKFFSELESLRTNVQSEREAREAALAAWESAEARANKLADAQKELRVEMQRELKVMMEEKKVLEKNVEWQIEQNRKDDSRLRQAETEVRKRIEECTALRIKLANIQTEVRAAMEMEQIKAQVTLESLTSEVEHREQSMQAQIQDLQRRLANESIEKLKAEKALKRSELSFQDQMREREQQWRQQQQQQLAAITAQQQQAAAAAQTKLALPSEAQVVQGANLKSARIREIAEIDAQIANLNHQIEHQQGSGGQDLVSQSRAAIPIRNHPAANRLSQLGSDLFKRNIFSMPPQHDPAMMHHNDYGHSGYPLQPPNPHIANHPSPASWNHPHSQHAGSFHQQQHGHAPGVSDLNDEAWEQEFWSSADPLQPMKSPPRSLFMAAPQPIGAGSRSMPGSSRGLQQVGAATNHHHGGGVGSGVRSSVKPPHFVSPMMATPVRATASAPGGPNLNRSPAVPAVANKLAKAAASAAGGNGKAPNASKPPLPPGAAANRGGAGPSGGGYGANAANKAAGPPNAGGGSGGARKPAATKK